MLECWVSPWTSGWALSFFVGSALHLGTLLGHCSTVPLAGSSVPWKIQLLMEVWVVLKLPVVLSAQLMQDTINYISFFSFSFPVRPHPNFFLLRIVKETKAIHLRNLQRETQPSRNTSRRAEKQPQTSQLMTSGAFQKKRAFLWFGYSWSWVVPHLE